MRELMHIYEEVLNEGASKILYHFTWDTKLKNILSTNTLYLTTSVATSADKVHNKGKDYYMSFTRTKSTAHGYGNKYNRPRATRIKFDGQKLSHNYKVIPIDYWQYPRDPSLMGGSGDEMEDRLLSNKDEIPNANKYIISIDIFVDEEGVDRQMIRDAKNLGIKLYFYDNEKAFAYGDPKYSVKPNIKDGESDDRDISIGFGGEILGAILFKSPENEKLIRQALEDTGVDIDSVIAYAKKRAQRLDDWLWPDDDYRLIDSANSLGAELSNNRSNSHKAVREVNRLFVNDFKKYRVDSLRDYLNAKIYKGKKTHKEFNKEFIHNINNQIDKSLKDGLSRINYDVYTKDGENINLVNYQPLLDLYNEKVGQIKKYCKEYLLDNNDMYKFSYLLSANEIKDKVDISADFKRLASQLENVDGDELAYPINVVLWELDDFVYKEKERIRSENQNQWRKE